MAVEHSKYERFYEESPRLDTPNGYPENIGQLNKIFCRCRSCGCVCACARGDNAVESESESSATRKDSDNTSIHSTASSNTEDISDAAIAGQEGVEDHEERVGYDNSDEFGRDLIAHLERRINQRMDFAGGFPSPMQGQLSRVDSSLSMLNEASSSGARSMAESMMLPSPAVSASPYLGYMGGHLESYHFVRLPLGLGYEQEFCRNLRLGSDFGRRDDDDTFAS